MIIGILGKKRNGKDTSADHIVNKYGFEKISFAAPLKEIIKILFDFDDDILNSDLKDEFDEKWNTSPRALMQYIGTDIMRIKLGEFINKSTNDIWVDICMNKILKSGKNYVISDVRYQNEVDAIHKNNGIVIKVFRNIDNDDLHISETSIDNITNYDYIIDNNADYNKLYDNLDNIMCARFNLI